MLRFPSSASLAGVLGAIVLSGCAKAPVLPPLKLEPPPPPPTVARLDISAAANVNADHRGRATPVVMRYYILQNTAAFDSADFFSLFERDEAVLGSAKVIREELTLKPGQTLSTELKPNPDGKFVAVFVAYRDANATRWRATAPLPANKTSTFAVQVGQAGVTITAKSS